MRACYLLASFFFLILSCKKSPNNGIPCYISIQNYSIEDSTLAAPLHEITSVWVESDGDAIGTYDIPKVFPALIEGNSELIINAGIDINGDYYYREIYPALQPFKITQNFTPKDTHVVTPHFKYYPDIDFPIDEDFETSNIFPGIPTTNVSNPNNIDGKALYISLDQNIDFIESVMATSIEIPQSRRVFMEFQFKGNTDIAFGIQSVENGTVVGTYLIDVFFGKSEWKNLYYDITNLLIQAKAESYYFYIQSELYPNASSSEMYIDNFKIVVI